VRAGNGLYADLHDFQIGSNDTALLTAYDPVHCDLSSIGGPANGAVTDGVFQEIDLATGLVRREWRALDHVPIADTYAKVSAGEARTAFPFDFFHINSLQSLPEGKTMVSSRNTWTIYTHSPPVSAGMQGNVQTLPNGNVMIGWGVQPYIDEYSADGQLLFGASVAAPSQSYRAFRETWSAQPASKPALTVEPGTASDSWLAYVSWNGATQVAGWRVLAGRSRQQLEPVASAARSGFETAIRVPGSGPWFQVQALGPNGAVLGSSTLTRG
jgi:hypothetical protein